MEKNQHLGISLMYGRAGVNVFDYLKWSKFLIHELW